MLAIFETDDLKTVRELERLRIEATRQNDAEVLAPLFHEQLIYVNSAGEVFDKERYLRSIRTHELTYDRDFDVRETEVRVLDDVVILAEVMLGHSRLDGEQQVFHFPCIGVWRRTPINGECSPGNRHQAACHLKRKLSADPRCGHLAVMFCIKWGHGRAGLARRV